MGEEGRGVVHEAQGSGLESHQGKASAMPNVDGRSIQVRTGCGKRSKSFSYACVDEADPGTDHPGKLFGTGILCLIKSSDREVVGQVRRGHVGGGVQEDGKVLVGVRVWNALSK